MENLELSPLQDKINKNIEQSHFNPTIDKDKMVIRRNGDTVYFISACNGKFEEYYNNYNKLMNIIEYDDLLKLI